MTRSCGMTNCCRSMTSECFSLSESNPLAYQMVTHPLAPSAREGELICLPSLVKEGELYSVVPYQSSPLTQSTQIYTIPTQSLHKPAYPSM
ncbi:hypothetical protein [Helicobacter macacae]|uniref:hypothetical protein n=1 Tax=Helicobacter macacae TaxID=398626 RepID=UPI0011DD6154|nr:hypothetical protein [Helicobacter macacae]